MGSDVTLNVNGSFSVSEPVSVTVLVVSMVTDTVCASATGGSFTVTDTVPVAVPPLPSLTS